MSKFKCEIYDLNNQITELNNEKKDKQKELEHLQYDKSSLEEKGKLLIKEKKYIESLIIKISKLFPSREICKVINDILNINEAIFHLEKDKFKVDMRLNLFLNAENEELTKSNNELIKTIQTEIENLKDLSLNYEKKINDKKDILKNLEFDLKNVEIVEKKKYELFFQNEVKIKQLELQLNENIDEIKEIS